MPQKRIYSGFISNMYDILNVYKPCRIFLHFGNHTILHPAFDLFNFRIPLPAAMWALFLVALFTFLRKSNLVPDNMQQISSNVITRANLVFTFLGANIHVSTTKTIKCQQRSLILPIPAIPGSRLCPILALRRHLANN